MRMRISQQSTTSVSVRSSSFGRSFSPVTPSVHLCIGRWFIACQPDSSASATQFRKQRNIYEEHSNPRIFSKRFIGKPLIREMLALVSAKTKLYVRRGCRGRKMCSLGAGGGKLSVFSLYGRKGRHRCSKEGRKEDQVKWNVCGAETIASWSGGGGTKINGVELKLCSNFRWRRKECELFGSKGREIYFQLPLHSLERTTSQQCLFQYLCVQFNQLELLHILLVFR